MLPRLAQLEDILEKTDKIMSKLMRKNSLQSKSFDTIIFWMLT